MNKKVLVVDNDEQICKIFKRFLTQEGYDVKYVLKGMDAIDIIQKEKFGFIFLDIVMPGLSGMSVLEQIKAYSPYSKVIMITGMPVDGLLVWELKNKGAHRYVRKPLKMEELLKTLKSFAETKNEEEK